MIFTQFVDDALGCASYLVGGPETGEAVVVDPAFAIEQNLEEAERREARTIRTVETHTHADHLSGHGRLALEHEIPVSSHAAAGAEYPHGPLEDLRQSAADERLCLARRMSLGSAVAHLATRAPGPRVFRVYGSEPAEARRTVAVES